MERIARNCDTIIWELKFKQFYYKIKGVVKPIFRVYIKVEKVTT